MPQWQQQPNGVEAILGVTLVADNPSTLHPLYAQLFGAEKVRGQGTTLVAQTPNGRLEVVTSAGLEQRYEWAGVQAEAVRPYIAGVTLKAAELTVVERIFRENAVSYRKGPNGIVALPEAACGALLEFVG